MGLPKTLKVGGAVYEVRSWDCSAAGESHLCGRAIHYPRAIEISDTLVGSRAAETLLHEVLHCIEVQWDLGGAPTPEHRVEVYERGLHAVIVDNPKLFDWIVEELRKPHRGD